MNQIDTLIRRLPKPYSQWMINCRSDLEQACELRFRTGRHTAVTIGTIPFFLSENGLSRTPDPQSAPLEQKALIEIISSLCEYSVFSHSESLKEGFLTISGGHRVGVCTSINRQGAADLGSVSSINIRIANERPGCAAELIRRLGALPQSVLLCGPPLSGKTTILRDYARILSDGPLFYKCVLIDERGELAAMQFGRSPFRLGECTDVIDRFSRVRAIDTALRTLSPQIILCDEIGSAQDERLLLACARSGIRFVASAHASNLEDLKRRDTIWPAVQKGIFDAVVFLSNAPRIGTLKSIYKAV